MFGKVRNGLVALVMVGGLFGVSQVSGIKTFVPTGALAACYSSVSNQDLTLVNNAFGKSIVGHVTLSTWCSGDTVHAVLTNESNGAHYDYSTSFTTNGTYQDLSKSYVTPGVWCEAYACGPLNCTANVSIQTT